MREGHADLPETTGVLMLDITKANGRTPTPNRARPQRSLAFALSASLMLLAGQAQSQSTAATPDEWSRSVWSSALAGDGERLTTHLADAEALFAPESGLAVRDSVDLLKSNIQKRESERAEQIEKLSKEIDEKLAPAPDGTSSPSRISDALRSAVELSMITTDKRSLLAEPRIRNLMQTAETAARDAEANADWLVANEIFYRLNLLTEEERTYEADLNRQTARLGMIRLYAPERFWTLRNDRRIAEGLSALPPYNPTADSYVTKTEGITTELVERSLSNATLRFVERESVGMRDILIGGLDGVRTLVTLPDVRSVFPGLADDTKRTELITYLDQQIQAVRDARFQLNTTEMRQTIDRLMAVNRNTVGLSTGVLLHEFGNGAMARLDPFSNIIWPDDLKTFQRQTQGRFVGVGIQIQLDEQQNIKITSPLDGTPAQRAGIRSGDLIKKVDGVSTAGFTLDQAVNVITGEPNKVVVLTVERKVGEEIKQIDVPITRANIDVKTVKGWERTGPGDQDWNYFIDADQRIGYLRLTQFTDTTTRDFDRAVQKLRSNGMQGLILDLRYNPGGLLDQAVSIASRFIPQGVIVRTETSGQVMVDQQTAQPSRVRLNDIPIIVLINEGSASASEIVSGAIQDYAKKGVVEAIVLGKRSYGKGSVQNVWMLTDNAAMKLTTQYYRLPGGRLIDKNRLSAPDAWGVMPDLVVDRLPKHESEGYEIRQLADIAELDETGNFLQNADARPDPRRLITEGLDLQLQTALTILQTKTNALRLAGSPGAAANPN